VGHSLFRCHCLKLRCTVAAEGAARGCQSKRRTPRASNGFVKSHSKPFGSD
jgi:hypothetical protein